MKYKCIPHSDLNVSVIGLGTWIFGGDSWSGADEGDCLGAIEAAADLGVNFIDTAPIYGNGRSEQIVGKGIRQKRDRWIIATKCGPQKQGGRVVNDLSARSIARQLDDSLRRLNIDCIDLYQCHWPDDKTPIEETFEYLNKAQQQGKIRYIGVSNFEVDLLQKAVSAAKIVTLQSQYSLLEKSLEESVIPFCLKHKIGILAYGPLGGGILTGKYKKSRQFQGVDARQFFYKYYGEHFNEVNQVVERLSRINKPLNQIALNWVRQKESVISVLAGCRNAIQVAANAGAAGWDLSGEEIDMINEVKCGS
jgi:aryl-alcohol dehydrogenase-like predicted oxidoreductase